MRIGNIQEFLEIIELERCPPDTPTPGDVRVSIAVALGDFTGKSAVWLDERALRDFVASLVELERTRRGEAVLRSMSPDELTLKIRSRDSLGHLVVEVQLSRYQYSGPTYWPTSVAGGFEWEPSDLPLIVREFRKLMNE